jgi:predicted CopG family antitoxin
MPTRTTITLADDVTAKVEQMKREQGIGVSEAINDLARAGMIRKKEPRKRFVQRTYNLGEELIDVTNVAEALEQAEGPGYR